MCFLLSFMSEVDTVFFSVPQVMYYVVTYFFMRLHNRYQVK